MGIFDNNSSVDVNYDCPNCKNKLSFKVNLKAPNTAITCPNCNQEISLDDSNLKQSIKDVEKQLDDMSKKFK